MNLYKYTYPFFKKIAFGIDPEAVHEFTIHSMNKLGSALPDHHGDSRFNIKAMGLNFTNPIGLAAGLDKNAEVIPFMTHLPFGFVEIGTVTPLSQAGNDRPRLFRYVEEESLRNRMGFNNHGADVILENLKRANRRGKIVGANLGKNKITANSDAPMDYSVLYKKFAPHSDYLVINVSSPNTPGLRDLLKDAGLRQIFEAVVSERSKIKKPLLVKVSPDMALEELASVVGLVKEYSLDGIIATNTTIMKDRGEGGISGKLLTAKAKETREFLLKEIKYSKTNCELIGVGGIFCFEDLMDFWRAGGKLTQIYSGLIFKGPGLLYEIEERLSLEFNKRGVRNFEEFLESVRRV
ncbi:MAG: quinone-dependent dihydroorotate dehydrogenase [Bdellovibrionales bacterium]|nr:quinone-dependent dihydroorotate dehydrogenase [Bdellovibrionales bacterium]